jgi:Uma2 family endonuclease
MKLEVNEDTFYYPDVFVACDLSPPSESYREIPILLIEATSPTTRQIDRREKLQAYQQMPSVQEYVIIEQDKITHRASSTPTEWQLDYIFLQR